jgi:hypothetical protein
VDEIVRGCGKRKGEKRMRQPHASTGADPKGQSPIRVLSK